MKREFILQQTTIPEKKYNSQTLIGNWYEEKCNPESKYAKFHRERKFEPNKYNSTTLKEEIFIKSNLNWLNFQPQTQMITTNYPLRQEYKKPEEQQRNSVLNKFITKKSAFDKDTQALQDYRRKWTTSPHFYDRTYLGTQK